MIDSDPFEDAPEPGAKGPSEADYSERDADADQVIAELIDEQAGADSEDDEGELAEPQS